MPIAIMICFSRSGGTLLNQCLGCLPNVVIMSEVNPLGGGWGRGPIQFDNIKMQAENWYNIKLLSNEFSESALELEKICNNNNKHLVLRDWPFINFVPHDYNNLNPPNRLLILDSLRNKSELTPFAFLRDSIDIWISRELPPADEFFDCYLKYIKTIIKSKMPIFKYEAFCKEPGLVLNNICDYTGLHYSDSYKNYATFINTNGDTQNLKGSRGLLQNKLKLLPRKSIPKAKIKEIDQCQKMIESNTLLGYPTTYHSVKLENLFSHKITFLKNHINNFFE